MRLPRTGLRRDGQAGRLGGTLTDALGVGFVFEVGGMLRPWWW